MNYINPDIINDGPYVFWDGDSLAYVGGQLDGQHYRQTFNVRDTLYFTDPFDSTKFYRIAPRYEIEPSIYVGVSKIFVVSDVEGHYDVLVNLLKNNGIIDDNLLWNWGDGHLIFLGDMVDRGDKVTETLWLIHQLELQAKQGGGRVHYVLGNHEAMILAGRTKYTHRKYNLIAQQFDMSYQSLYGPDTELGRWIRSKNAIIKINNLIFVHGGLSQSLIGQNMSIEAINKLIRSGLETPWKVQYDKRMKLLYGDNGPLWYRGYVWDTNLKADDVQNILSYYDGDVIVVGHTIVPTIQRRHGGRVIAIDVTFENPFDVEGLVWENDKFFRVGINGLREAL
jgi:predicted phosphodiesterase